MKLVAAATAMVFFSLAAAAQTDAAGDWITATNKPCKIWNPQPQANESVTWSGDCKDGLATGKGILQWTENGKPDVKFDGQYAKGKRNGPGEMITPDGHHEKGVWVDDEPLQGDRNAI